MPANPGGRPLHPPGSGHDRWPVEPGRRQQQQQQQQQQLQQQQQQQQQVPPVLRMGQPDVVWEEPARVCPPRPQSPGPSPHRVGPDPSPQLQLRRQELEDGLLRAASHADDCQRSADEARHRLAEVERGAAEAVRRAETAEAELKACAYQLAEERRRAEAASAHAREDAQRESAAEAARLEADRARMEARAEVAEGERRAAEELLRAKDAEREQDRRQFAEEKATLNAYFQRCEAETKAAKAEAERLRDEKTVLRQWLDISGEENRRLQRLLRGGPEGPPADGRGQDSEAEALRRELEEQRNTAADGSSALVNTLVMLRGQLATRDRFLGSLAAQMVDCCTAFSEAAAALRRGTDVPTELPSAPLGEQDGSAATAADAWDRQLIAAKALLRMLSAASRSLPRHSEDPSIFRRRDSESPMLPGPCPAESLKLSGADSARLSPPRRPVPSESLFKAPVSVR
eukprot:TRINITY_DN10285_c0_g1_i1.p1 TRINITY_DN10285_c0_g1~~TRINITY_DN10285_c0_g1_i1.p1  ORF type:complete len:474 (+),score=204.53 TRINITY_DN10285_c0_g1_i1:46-1422(+)